MPSLVVCPWPSEGCLVTTSDQWLTTRSETLSTPTTTQPLTGSDWEVHSHQDRELAQVLGLTSSTMLVIGSMIGSGIFIVSAEIAREIYFAILLDRATAAPLIVASTEGGVEIEAVAAKSPEKIVREPIAGLLSKRGDGCCVRHRLTDLLLCAAAVRAARA